MVALDVVNIINA